MPSPPCSIAPMNRGCATRHSRPRVAHSNRFLLDSANAIHRASRNSASFLVLNLRPLHYCPPSPPPLHAPKRSRCSVRRLHSLETRRKGAARSDTLCGLPPVCGTRNRSRSGSGCFAPGWPGETSRQHPGTVPRDHSRFWPRTCANQGGRICQRHSHERNASRRDAANHRWRRAHRAPQRYREDRASSPLADARRSRSRSFAKGDGRPTRVSHHGSHSAR